MNPVSKFTPKIRREKTVLSSNSDLSVKKDAVQVFCRLRPLKNDEESTCIKLLSPEVLALTTPAESRGIRKEVHCKFRHIFTAYASQNEVFEHVAYPLLDDLLKGKNGLLFTYGVTGSGKTYTLTGEQNNPGIMPKCIYTLFNTIGDYQAPKFVIKSDKMNGFDIQSTDDALFDIRCASKTPSRHARKPKDRATYVNDGIKILDINQNNLYAVFVSYIEIYNNTVYDLLDDNSGKGLQGKILREDSQKNMYVNGVIEVEVKSAEEAFEIFNFGQSRKRMGNTILNSLSSRSHSIFNIRVVQVQRFCQNEEGIQVIPDSNRLKTAQLSLVDLAGSERTNRTQNTGQLLREASQINNSLMSLRTCLEILRENQLTGSNRLVPYRDSRLTLLFKNYFEGEGKVEMIVCVNPSNEDFEENLQVMKFAEITQDVKVTRAEARYTPAKKTIQKKGGITPKVTVQSTNSFLIGPKVPEVCFNYANIKETELLYQKLANILKTRTQKVKTLDPELSRKENHFRKRLIEINQDHLIGKADLKSTKLLLKQEKQRNGNLDSKLSQMEQDKNDLNGKNLELQEMIRSLKNTINEKDMRLNQNRIDKQKTRQMLALKDEKMNHELDVKLRRQREHLNAVSKAKDHKIQKIREIVEKEITPPEIEEKQPEPQQQEPVQQYEPQQTPVRHQQPQQTRRLATPAATRSRRSRSAGEVLIFYKISLYLNYFAFCEKSFIVFLIQVWLEHNAVKPVPLGTILQPSMKKRKSVTKLSKASDVTNPKQSKYCLIAQEQLDGEFETKLYKGDIVPTCGGGAQVIFNDVEKLCQESPTK